MPENPYLEIDKLIIGEVYTNREVMDNLTILCDDFGSRFGGTDGEKNAADFMLAKMKEYGLKNVHLEPIEYIGWRRGTSHLEILRPINKPIDCITLPHSPPANLEGEIIDMGQGAPTDFDKRAAEIKGKIVLTTSEVHPKGEKRWIHRNEKYNRSLLAGATGFIFVNHYPGYGPATGGIGRNDQAPIPGISISYEDGKFIQRLIKRKGKVSIRLTSDDLCEPMTSWNIIGDIPGKQYPSKMVMLGCHYDGHDISQGAADPASGAVAVLEAARVLARYGGDMSSTIRFILWGVEEIGLIGSKEYVRIHDDELDDIRFYFNMDSAGAIPQKGVVLNEWPELETIFTQWSDEMALDFGVKQSVNAHSDHFPFLMAGVPTGGMGTVGKNASDGRGYGHTKHDTLDKVNLTGLREAAVLAACLALRMVNSDLWPVKRRSKDDVKAVLDSPDYQQESAYNEKVNAYYNELKKIS